ncbi:hypothetical protein ACHQM5_016823 [Ranunculus cassubicifolius]
MELELGLKITKTKDSLTMKDLRISKDRAGPLFFSRETEDMFVLTAYLKGFKRDRIKIDISKDKTEITISGDKHVQETVMKKWMMQKKETEIKGFKKAFPIPDGVLVDKIKAKFNKEESILSISMPKSVSGIQGKEVEEVKQEKTKGESSGITPSLPVETAEIPAKPKPEENKPEIREGGNVVEETKSEVSEIEEGSEIKSPMVSTDIPETMTADPAKEDIQPMPFQPEEVQQEQPREADQMNKKEVIEEEIEPEKPTELHENPHPEPADEQTIKETENKDLRKEEMNTAIEEIQKEKEPDMENLEAQRKENGDDHEMTEDQELQREEIQEEQPEIEEMKGDETHEQREVEAKEEKGNVKIQESGWIKSGFRPRPVFVGSALIGFLIVLVIQLMRQNTKKSRK